MIRTIALLVSVGLASSCAHASSSIAYGRAKVGRLVVQTITIDLSNPEVKVSVALASGGAGKCETFRSMMRRTRPAAAITGTFFDTKSLKPTGDIALFGTVVHSGCIGSALCVDANNKVEFVPLRTGRKAKWSGYETVLCAGPTLVADSRVAIGLKHEGFRRSLMSNSRRTAVGVTKSGKLIMVCVNRAASLYDFSKAMIKLGVRHAVCLDGGSSTAFYYQGGYLATPGRTLTNCLVVYSTAHAYNQAKNSLAPAKLFAKAPTKPVAEPTAFLPALLTPSDDLIPFLASRGR